MSNETFEFRPSGSIDFEHLEPAAVAKQMESKVDADDPIDRDPLSINYGRDKGTKPSQAETMLAGTTIDWLIAFPADSRPKALCDRFPHVANRLAGNWAQKTHALQSVQQLADDPRWGTAGFPAQVQGELQRLLK